MSTEANNVSDKPIQDYISRLSHDLRICMIETVNHKTPHSRLTPTSDTKQQSDLSNLGMVNKQWYNDVSQYKITQPFRQKNTLVIKDLTSLLLGRAAGTIEVRDGDTVAAILDRSGAREKLAESQLSTAATWVIQQASLSLGSVRFANETWETCGSQLSKQTLESLDWLADQIKQGDVKPPTIISYPMTETIDLASGCLLTCPINRKPLSVMFLRPDSAKTLTRLSNACAEDLVPILHLPRIALEGLDTIPRRAVFHEIHRPADRTADRKPTVSYPLDHTIEMNMSDCEGDWSHLEEYVDKLCRDHSALLELTTSSKISTLTLSFTVDHGDVETAETLREQESTLQAVVDKWEELANDKTRIRAVFGSEPSDAYSNRGTGMTFNAGHPQLRERYGGLI